MDFPFKLVVGWFQLGGRYYDAPFSGVFRAVLVDSAADSDPLDLVG